MKYAACNHKKMKNRMYIPFFYSDAIQHCTCGIHYAARKEKNTSSDPQRMICHLEGVKRPKDLY